MQATYLDTGDYFEGTAAANLASGDVVFAPDGRCGVITAMEGVLSGKKYRAQACGRYQMAADETSVWAAGADVYWNEADDELVATSAGNRFVGTAEVAKTSGQLTNIVTLKPPGNQIHIPAVASQALSGAGAINVTSYLTRWTTTGAAQAATLANGTRVNQLKKIQMVADGGDGIVTPTSLSGGTTITFADAGDVAVLLWNGTAWVVIELTNDADGATAPVLA